MELTAQQKFSSRQEISDLLGGDPQKGIAVSAKTPTILLFLNEGELYSDYFYPAGTYRSCMYTGIGRSGHQDSTDNNMYQLNIAVLSHQADRRHLLLFEKQGATYSFVGEYRLRETHQNVQPDEAGQLRRVFVFHLEQIGTAFQW